VTKINQRLATRINPSPKNHGKTEDKELDAPLHRPDRRTNVRSRFISTRTVPTRIAALTTLPAVLKVIHRSVEFGRTKTWMRLPRNPSKAATGNRHAIAINVRERRKDSPASPRE